MSMQNFTTLKKILQAFSDFRCSYISGQSLSSKVGSYYIEESKLSTFLQDTTGLNTSAIYILKVAFKAIASCCGLHK